jgi:ribosomal protein S12 methylthiotransferase accessory factor
MAALTAVGAPVPLALAAARAAASAAGVTRLADLTGFDRIGLPVWQAVRPMGRSLSVSQGKGRSRSVARLSALMEALELHHAETLPAGHMEPVSAPSRQLWSGHISIPSRRIAWLAGTDLLTLRPLDVPRGLVSLDTSVPADDLGAVSTGLAGHTDRTGAVLKGLCEVLERHAMAGFEAMGPMDRARCAMPTEGQQGRATRWLVARIRASGCVPLLWDLSAPFGVPIVLAVILDGGEGPMPLPPVMGLACHPHAETAAFAALAEAAQGRVTHLAGAREDIAPGDYAGAELKAVELVLAAAAFRASPKAAAQKPVPASRAEAVDMLLRALQAAGARAVGCIELAAGPALHVVKIIAPGLADSERQQ